MNILFICTGNTCRSPMAEVILKEKAPHLSVQSAGVFATENAPATNQAVEAMERKGIKLNHRAQVVNEQILQWADLVLTMTEQHKQLLNSYFPQYTSKVFSLIEYTARGRDRQKNIADPFGGDVALYEETAKEIEKYIDLLIKKIKK